MDPRSSSQTGPTTGESKTSKPVISSFDEPLILHHGGKRIRAYTEEALPSQGESYRDYSARAFFDNSFTNYLFGRLFSVARRGYLGVYPTWITCYLADRELGNQPSVQQLLTYGRRNGPRLAEFIRIVSQFEKGLLVLISIQGVPTELGRCSKNRVRKMCRAIAQHPTASYVLRGIAEITNMSLGAYVMDANNLAERNAHRHEHKYFRAPQTPARWLALKPQLSLQYNQLVDELEQAINTGNLDWFKQRYDDETDDEWDDELDDEWDEYDDTEDGEDDHHP